ncbi:MAG: YjbH domain-containing protein [Pseudomonadota bacterium]|nr:YjbH domain-containing protein [Pseudomonadota bacterium]
MLKNKLLLTGVCLLASYASKASIDDYYPYKVLPSASNYGNTGILEMPNARMMQEGQLRWNFSASYPNEFTTLTASPFNWLEATYRYTEIKNEKYGPSGYSGNQTLKDKGFDIKALIKKETYYFPAIALGLRDIAGSGDFSSEYLVGTKKYGKLDLTLGLGWGVLGTDNNIGNPLKSIREGFGTRNDTSDLGGSFTVKNWFSGKTALFGGIEYDIPKRGLRLKMEYDTSNPDFYEKVSKVHSRFNVGVDYSWSENLNITTAFERGSQFRVSFKLTGNFLNDSIPKPKPKKVAKLNKQQQENVKNNKGIFYTSLNLNLRQEGILIQGAELRDDEVDVAIATGRFFSATRPVGRTARMTAALAPDEVKKINIYHMNGDLEVAKFSIGRDYFERADNNKLSSAELLELSTIESPNEDALYSRAEFQPTVTFPEFNWNMSPGLNHQIGGPEGFYLGQLFWKTDFTFKFRRNLLLYSSLGFNIYDTFDDFANPSQSSIPKVRSDIQEYLSEGKNNIQRIQLEYFSQPFKDVFTRFDLGYLEPMFGGVGGEVLWRPFEKNYSLGFSLHKVKQRDYDQLFSFRDYQTTTGHLGIYYDFPYQIRSQLLIGKYLAGDKGATIDLSRRFQSGFSLGIFASKTNLSAEEFGEGSFDKGFYFSIPTQLFYADFSTGIISFGLHPLTKDGAAKLQQHNTLISIVGDQNRDSMIRDWDNLLK